MSEHKAKTAGALHSTATSSADLTAQKVIRVPDRPRWLEKAIAEQLKRKRQLTLQEKRLDELEEKIRSEDQRVKLLSYVVLSSPVVCCFILITVWLMVS